MKLFVWDFHGTLEQDNEFAVKEICEAITGKKISVKKVRELYGKAWGEYFKEMDPTMDEARLHECVEETRKIGRQYYKKHTRAADNAISVLSEVKKRGDVNVVLSNTRHDIIPQFLNQVKIAHLVDKTIGIPERREVMGHDTAAYKAEQISMLAKENDYDKIIVVGDAETDIAAGKRNNAVTFMIDRWDRHPNTMADYRIKDLREVLEVYS